MLRFVLTGSSIFVCTFERTEEAAENLVERAQHAEETVEDAVHPGPREDGEDDESLEVHGEE